MTGIKNEFLKLRTVRSPLLVLAAAQLVVLAGVSGLFVNGADLGDPATPLRAVGHAGLVSIVSLVLGIVGIAGEYRHKTITDTYLGTPRRGRVITAKLAVYAAAGAVLGLVSSLVAFGATALWLSGKGSSLDLSDPALWRTMAGCVIWNACFGAIGVGLGALIRNLVGAVAAALAWIALVEGIVVQLVGGFDRWLPFNSGLALEGVPAPAVDLLPRWGGGLVLAAYALLFALVAVSTTVRRDVS
ncbi:ABC transporter permease subunit [Kribbella qitaiheensis]|uniref:ABC transporter permease subunit n=1 Tax=Kribbella qitaiheensis TaxID=1544730 RepID=UPI00361FEC72